ncbi:MAG: hypothetical protein QOE62_552 [Actinomycetota bacterium]|nr:hypothetical protein [Actinomycetota bacterium]
MSGVLLALAALLVLGVSGAGIALNLPRVRSGPIGFAFESIAIGIVVQEVVGLVALRTGHYSRPTVLVLTLVVIVVSVALFVRKGRATPGIGRTGPAANRPVLAAVAVMVVLVGIALVIRQGPSYFIFETGDMGEYVNAANILARTGNLSASFPHGFTVFLGGTNLLFGQAHTVAAVPALGIGLVLGASAYARAIGLHVVAALGIAALVVAHPVTVWFSLFPVSEALYATLLIAALYFVVQARANLSYAHAVLGGLIVGLMLIVRGNALLLAPIVVLVLFASAAVDDERTVRVQRAFTVVALVALSASYAYDLHYPRTYFVQTQLRGMVPHGVFKVANRAKLFNVSIPLVLVVAAGLAAVLGATVLITRFVRPRVVDRPETFWRSAYGVLVGGTVVALIFMHHGGLVDATLRWGPVLVLLTLAGLAAVLVRPGRYLDGVNGWLLLLVTCSYTLLFAARVKISMPHAYYLYYDRYLSSEVLPAALVFAAIGLHLIVQGFERATAYEARKRTAARLAIAALCVIAAVAFLPNLKETHRITRYPLFGDAYQALDRLDTLTRSEGNGAIVYSAPPTPPPGWFFQNTYRAFALPLGLTFGRSVVGMPSNPFARDVQFDPARARAQLAASGFDKGYLVALRAPGAGPAASATGTKYLGTVDYVSPLLKRTVKRKPAAFQLVSFHFDVYALS